MKKLFITLSSPKLNSKANDSAIIEAIAWLAQWYACSWDIQDKYKTPAWVEQHLAPLKAVVPFKYKEKQLYRVLGYTTKQSIDKKVLLSSNLSSYTTLSKTDSLVSLADQVGSLNEPYCYATKIVSTLTPLFDYKWALVDVLKYALDKYPEARETRQLLNQEGYAWQREVTAYSSEPKVKATIVKQLN